MTKQLAVYSTLTADVDYTFWDNSGINFGQQLTAERTLRINGKANLATKALYTPRGAVTMISEEEHNLLNSHPVFKQHMLNGFITVDEYTDKIDAIVADMVPRDASAPLEIGDIDDSTPQPLVSEQQANEEADKPTTATVTTATAAKGRANTSRKTQTKAKK